MLIAAALVVLDGCQHQDEPTKNVTLTVQMVKNYFENQLVDSWRPNMSSSNDGSTTSRFSPEGIDWSSSELVQLQNGEILKFDLKFDGTWFMGTLESGLLTDVRESIVTIAYQVEDEIRIEVIKTIKTSEGEGFSGYLFIEDWFGQLLRVMEFKEDKYVGDLEFSRTNPSSSARTSEYICGYVEVITYVGAHPDYMEQKTYYDYVCIGVYTTIESDSPLEEAEYKNVSGGGASTPTCNPETHEYYNGQCVPKCELGRDENGNCNIQIQEEINIEVNTENPCITKSVTDFLNAIPSDLKTLIESALSLKEGFVINIYEDDFLSGTTVDADAAIVGALYIDIAINPDLGQSSKEYHSVTIIHEMFHATWHFYYHYRSNYDSTFVNDDLSQIDSLLANGYNLEQAHHELMNSKYREVFMSSFLELNPEVNSKDAEALVNFGIIPQPSSQLEINESYRKGTKGTNCN